jgi:hypothetical protein
MFYVRKKLLSNFTAYLVSMKNIDFIDETTQNMVLKPRIFRALGTVV